MASWSCLPTGSENNSGCAGEGRRQITALLFLPFFIPVTTLLNYLIFVLKRIKLTPLISRSPDFEHKGDATCVSE
jgi:hypothetical protein